MKYRVTIVYGSLASQTFDVTATDCVGATHAAFAAQRAAGWLPLLSFWQRPFVVVDEVVERPRSTEPLRVVRGRAA